MQKWGRNKRKNMDENIGMTQEQVNVLCKIQQGTWKKHEEQ